MSENNEMEHPVKQMVEQGMRIAKIENETQQLIAIQRPRDEKKVLAAVLEELNIMPELAQKAYYSIPHKGDGGEIVLVEGASIKAAMVLARRWGNNANGNRVVDELDDRIITEGVMLDYETNIRTLRTVSVAKNVWSKKVGKVITLRDDRLNMAVQAGLSKATRNAILASLPVYLVETYLNAAKKIAISLKSNGNVLSGTTGKIKNLTVKERINKAISYFEKLDVKSETVKKYIKSLPLETDEDILAHLIGLYTAIKDGQTTTENVFGAKNNIEMEKQEKNMSLEDIANGK